MFVFLSYPLNPADLGWPGGPDFKTEPTAICGVNGNAYNTSLVHLPNHFGTHFDAPKHFNNNGPSMVELPIDYFVYKQSEILLVNIPKGPKEGIVAEDLKPYEDQIKKVKLLLIRTGFDKYKFAEPALYVNEGPYLHPDCCKYMVETFDGLLCVGLDFLSVGTPANDLAAASHQWLLGVHTKKFITAIEDMPMSPLDNKKIISVTLGPLRIEGIDSAQLSIMAEVEE